ncbi:MAG: hypothetical protein M1418_10265 [Deltaproteobacteria bacterium]|nr:hypothetical protein [Deltaproteobacteria bacterium]
MRPIVRSRERTIGIESKMNPLDRHVVVDLETTGLSPRLGRRSDDGKYLDSDGGANKESAGSRIFQNIVGADSSEENIIIVYLKREPIEHVDAAFPAVFKSFHFLDSERRMSTILNEDAQFPIKKLLNAGGQLLIVLLEGFCKMDIHAFRSASKSSTEVKHATRPAAISASASASAFSQSKFRKYGGSVRAYFSSSKTAARVSLMLLFRLKFANSTAMSSGISSVIVRSVFMGHLFNYGES